jgi:ABC-type dipeptide/oligopeptide/nickel transport system ATPase component
MSRRVTKIAIEKLNFKIDYFKDQTILLLGTSGTGKSKIILDIMNLIKDDVPTCYVFSPTNSVNHTYTDIIPNACISEDVNLEQIKCIFELQEKRIEIYKMCNDKQTLTEIAYKLNSSIVQIIQTINLKYAQSKKKIEKSNDNVVENIEELDNQYNKTIIKYLKKHIKENYNANNSILNETENNIVNLLDINVNILLIFDDCAATAKDWGKSEIIKKIFYQGRHYKITTIISLQGDKELIPVIRQNAFTVFFTTLQCATGFFGSTSNNFSKEQKKDAELKGKEIFKKIQSKDSFRKMCYIRLEEMIYYHKAELRSKFIYNQQLFDKFQDNKNQSIQLTNAFIKQL